MEDSADINSPLLGNKNEEDDIYGIFGKQD